MTGSPVRSRTRFTSTCSVGGARLIELATAARGSALKAVCSHIGTGDGSGKLIVFNSLAHERSDLVEVIIPVPHRGARSIVVRDSAGHEIPVLTAATAYHPDGTVAEVRAEFLAAKVPSLGYRCYGVERSGEAPANWAPVAGLSVSNERFLVEADPARGGGLNRVVDRRAGQEVLAAGAVGNELLVYPEYPQHPQMTEGPWHLLPAEPAVGSSARRAQVHAETSPLGERLVIEGEMDVMAYTQVVTLLAGSDRIGLTTYLRGFSGVDRLVRLRFPAAVSGGTPLAEVGNAVVARNFGFPDVDSATAPWTLDTPVQAWAGVGSTLAVRLAENEDVFGSCALGVAEVITPTNVAADLQPGLRVLVVALAARGVTASCTDARANRYGGLLGDSNLPDVRICLGGPEENELTALVLESAGPAFRSELQRQLASSGTARLRVPAARSFDEVWAPNADVRDPRDLPVLIVAGSDAATLEREVNSLTDEVRDGGLVVRQPTTLAAGTSDSNGDVLSRAAESTVVILNRGTPGFLVDKNGAIYISLLRSCTGWPSGVWIDPPRRTAPDGSNFELEHWDHVYEHALVAGTGDWRDNGCAREALSFNTPLVAVVEEGHPGELPPTGSLLDLNSPGRQVVLTVLKRAGNPLARGETGEPEADEGHEYMVGVFDGESSGTPGAVGAPGASDDAAAQPRHSPN